MADVEQDARDFASRYRAPLLIVAVTAVLDIAGRIVLGFDMIRVSAMEAALFATAGILLMRTARRRTDDHRVTRTALILSVLFFAAALRAATWATTSDVFLANMVILAAAFVGLIVWIWRRRRA